MGGVQPGTSYIRDPGAPIAGDDPRSVEVEPDSNAILSWSSTSETMRCAILFDLFLQNANLVFQYDIGVRAFLCAGDIHTDII